MAYERSVQFRWGAPPGGVTFFVTMRGLVYRREVGPHGSVSLHEAAVLLNKDFSTLFRWVQARKLKARRDGQLLVVQLSEVKRLLPSAGGRNWEPV